MRVTFSHGALHFEPDNDFETQTLVEIWNEIKTEGSPVNSDLATLQRPPAAAEPRVDAHSR